MLHRPHRAVLLAVSLASLVLAPTIGCQSQGQSTGQTASPAVPRVDPTPLIGDTIDHWHESAARADFENYFGLMTDDAVFLGTDATERWSRLEFEAFARPYFAAGRGWAYEPLERHILLSPEGTAAWFDERLRNDSLGECRGTGVMRLGPDGIWRVAHYSLTIPIPNAIARQVAASIQELESSSLDSVDQADAESGDR